MPIFFQQYEASMKYSIELVFQGTNLYSYWIIPLMFVLGLVNMSLLAFELVASIKAWHQEPVSQRTDEAYNPNFVKSCAAVMQKMMIQSCHKFAHATTAQL